MSDATFDSFVSGRGVILPSRPFPSSLIEEDEKQKDILLAKRTSQLMSSYRDYIKEVENDMKGHRLPDYRHATSTKTDHLIRDWNSEAVSSAQIVGLNKIPFGSSDAAINVDDDRSLSSCGSKERKNNYAIYTRKRARFYGVVIACALIGLAVRVKREAPSRNLPDWEGELKEELEGEAAMKTQGKIWPAAGQEESKSSSKTDTNQSTPVLPLKNKIGLILHQKFKPLWLSAKGGWNGGSHQDAIDFCAATRGRNICPYAAICPKGDGEDAIVMGGRHSSEFKVEGEQWAPVFGNGNNWVMIGEIDGEPSAKCKTYHQMERSDPDWGLSGDRADIKKHIMCCNLNQ